MMRKCLGLLLMLIVALLLVVPEVKAHEAVPIGAWTATGSMATSRFEHTATLLGDGTVLVAGGQDSIGHSLSTAEIYDPTNETWSAPISMMTSRYGHSATLLTNGKVLLTGGLDNIGHALNSATIYDPVSKTWTATGTMTIGRVFHTATLLTDGRVLVVGGQDTSGRALSTAEIYNPVSGTWSAIKSMLMTRIFHTATLLTDGRVLVAGGRDSNGSILTTAEIYNPISAMWSPTHNMAIARAYHVAILLGTGKVVVIGGGARTAELYDPTTGTWSSALSMATSRVSHTATLLNNGTILVSGGRDNNSQTLASTEIFDPVKGIWSTTGTMNAMRWGQTATLLGNGKVLVVGGQDNAGRATTSAELFFVSDTTAPTLQLPAPITVSASTLQGATISYVVTATDPDDTSDQIAINCTPASGSLFPIGATIVTCSAQDSSGNASTGSFSVQVAAPDTTAPTLQLPSMITANATSRQGTTVTYDVTATDPDDATNQVIINCTPTSGSTFPVGTTTVTCGAQDLAGNTSTGSFQIVVQDVTSPILHLPTTLTVNTTTAAGATVNYAVTATDPTNAVTDIVISCTPTSGSVFPTGSTPVTCTAQDPAGNTSTKSFQVVVQDVVAPTLVLPVAITADAVDPQGAIVNYVVTATDPTNTSDQITINCTPASGSVFSLGTTTVFCSAQDPSGNMSTGSFRVVVTGVTAQINKLITLINDSALAIKNKQILNQQLGKAKQSTTSAHCQQALNTFLQSYKRFVKQNKGQRSVKVPASQVRSLVRWIQALLRK